MAFYLHNDRTSDIKKQCQLKRVFSLALLTALLYTTALAHEYILLSNSYHVTKGDSLELRLFVGDGFNIMAERPLQQAMTKKFELHTPRNTRDLLKGMQGGQLPIYTTKVDFEGQGLFAMERDYATVTLPNAKFKSYLAGDNIEGITIDETTKTEQRERYTRYIKTLIQSDPTESEQLYAKRVGHTFELILLDDPYQQSAGSWITAQAYYRGRPLAYKAITARNRMGSEAATYQYARTDAEGKCQFKLERGGEWFLHATHMIPAPEGSGVDWESFWTTYTFGVGDAKSH